MPMSRLVQGDVGSGKTVVAAAALLAAIENGRQGVMMAPTEILAEQHFRTLKQLLGANGSERPGGVGALSDAPPGWRPRPSDASRSSPAASKAKERRELYRALEDGEIDVACGTHALIQGGVRFHDLGIAVVDEQHRFGVMQRAALREKGAQAAHTPHMLVMTATPIPRTLALTLYGDLDISVIDEMPPGRQPIKTTWVGPDERDDAERFVRGQVELGRQAFVICPLVEESEALDVKAATAEYERLRRQVYPDLRLELLHGRMAAKQKDDVMRRFRDREADILVSTAVIEVGIDVPNATVMMIEGAGPVRPRATAPVSGARRARRRAELLPAAVRRAGRGSPQAPGADGETNDGFRLAEADMELRGPGQFFGTKQSGLPGLKVAKLTDVKLIELTRGEAAHILDEDHGLTKPEHHALSDAVGPLMQSIIDEEH